MKAPTGLRQGSSLLPVQIRRLPCSCACTYPSSHLHFKTHGMGLCREVYIMCTFAEREDPLRHQYLPGQSKVWQRKGGGCTRQGRTAVAGGRVGGRCWVECWVALPLLGPALIIRLRQAAALHPAKPELTAKLPLRVWRRQAFLPATSCGPAPITSLAEFCTERHQSPLPASCGRL